MARAEIDQYIIDTVRRLRTERKISQDDLADAIGVSKGLIGMIESARYIHTYSAVQLNELAKVFNCSPRDFWPEKPI